MNAHDVPWSKESSVVGGGGTAFVLVPRGPPVGVAHVLLV
jgi:hypothetical protein